MSHGNSLLTKTGKLTTADITIQTRQVIQNIQAILEAADCSLKDVVVQSTVYLYSMSLFEGFNQQYPKHFQGSTLHVQLSGALNSKLEHS